MNKLYPIGSMVRYLPVNIPIINSYAKADIGKIGRVVGYSGGNIQVALRDSEMMKYTMGRGYVGISIKNVRPLKGNVRPLKGQLLFDFMYE